MITRDRDNFNMLSLDSKSVDPKVWYLVQTNYDHWKTPPFFDDRRTPATKCLSQAGQKNASLGLIYNVLSSKPVLNKVKIYSSVTPCVNYERICMLSNIFGSKERNRTCI